jgi:molecular chaperone GrpE
MEPNRTDPPAEEIASDAPLAPEVETAEPTVPLEQHQRLLAEFDNFRKRVEREMQRMERVAVAGLLRRLLPVLDDLARAETALQGPEEGEIDRAATLKILGLLAEALRREGLERIDAPPGAVFDPNEHEAVLTIPTAGVPDGSVAEVLQTGYRFGDRLLRPARVAVARAPESGTEGQGSGTG